MKRFSGALKTEVENPKVDAFLTDIAEVYRKHGMAFDFDDYAGCLEVVLLDDRRAELLAEAHDWTGLTMCSLNQWPNGATKTEMLPDGTYVMRNPKTGVAYNISTGAELPGV